jgi:hypothetical protein
MRKLIDFDDETLAALTLLGRNRMVTLQELADEAFAGRANRSEGCAAAKRPHSKKEIVSARAAASSLNVSIAYASIL